MVDGYAVETPLLLNSATDRFPQGLANSSGMVGRYVTVQANQAVWGVMDREVGSYKGPPSLVIAEHRNYDDNKDFPGCCCCMSQGPLPQLWASTQFSVHGLWGDKLMSGMERFNHTVGLKALGEFMPQKRNAVTLAGDKDQYGLPVARDIWRQEDDTCHLNGGAHGR